MAAILDMSDEQLKSFIRKTGDRIALVNFCRKNKRCVKGKSNSLSLIEKLRKNQVFNQKDRSDKEEEEDLSSKKAKLGRPLKETRKIQIGWLLNGVPVRQRRGGGSRELTVSKKFRKADILTEAVELFFPNGISKEGLLTEFTYDLLDFKENTFDENLTVGTMYNLAKIPVLRFYLATNKISNKSASGAVINTTETEPTGVKETDEAEDKSTEVIHLTDDDLNISGHELTFQKPDEQLNVIFVKNNEGTDTPSPTPNDNEIFQDFWIFHDTTNVMGDTFNNSVMQNATISSSATVTVHRGQIFDELTNFFLTVDNLHSFIEITIVNTNGQPEVAVDAGHGCWRCFQGRTFRILANIL